MIGRSNINFCWVLQCRCRFRNQKQKLCRYRFRNRQQKPYRCRLKNWQPKTVLLLIQKSATKNCVAVDLEIDNDGGVIYGFTFFYWMFTFSPPNINFVLKIRGTRIDSALDSQSKYHSNRLQVLYRVILYMSL